MGHKRFFLDGAFNLFYFAAGLFSVKVAALVAHGDDDSFPHGYSYFEALVNGIKGFLVLGISIMALLGAFYAILMGGTDVEAGLAVLYGCMASSLSAFAYFILQKGYRVTASPLVKADQLNWKENFSISTCVLLAFMGIWLLTYLGYVNYAKYVDPLVVMAVVVITLGIPIRMSWHALMSLLNKAPSEEIISDITRVIDAQLIDFTISERFIRVEQPGRQRMVLVHVVLNKNDANASLFQFDKIREKIFQDLTQKHLATVCDIMFTLNRKWGARYSDGGMGAVG